MAKMPQNVIDLINSVPTAILATSDADGNPNAVPVGMKAVAGDDVIVISDQFFNKTLANLLANPKAAVTVWSGNEGYQIKGTAVYENEGERFEEVAKMVDQIAAQMGAPLKSKGACFIDVEEIYSVAPGPEAGSSII